MNDITVGRMDFECGEELITYVRHGIRFSNP